MAALIITFLLTLAARAGAQAERTADRVVAAFKCIHRYEGAWTANTGNGYYGGLQMDATFERAYGGEFVRMFGHANRWPPALQIAVAVKAWTYRGYTPWPNTARRCGLR